MSFASNIDSTQFEELCYLLLESLGFSNLSWRKGTSLTSTTSDQGRDIEASFSTKEADGSTRVEKWFIECKHYQQGVPTQAIQGALAWAESADPDTLLIATSGFLSNSTKEHLEQYRTKRSPRFRIKVWERPDFERMLQGRPQLLNRFGLAPKFPYWDIMHPAHRLFLKQPPTNTLDYF